MTTFSRPARSATSVPRIIFRQILPNTLRSDRRAHLSRFRLRHSQRDRAVVPRPWRASPVPSWGADLSAARLYSRRTVVEFFPGLAIFFLVLALNLSGDGLRDLLDLTTDPGETRGPSSVPFGSQAGELEGGKH